MLPVSGEPDVHISPEASWDLYEMIQAFLQAPSYHLIFEAALIVWIVKLLFVKSYKSKSLLTEKIVLAKKEKEELIEEWQPEPLVPEVDPNHPVLQDLENRLVKGKVGKYVDINSRKCINLASMNFLGMSGREDIEEEAVQSLRKYGVGSCGPRGFYGTVDVHLELEDKLAKFMNVEEALMYSYGFATIASAIPAYAKRGDVIFCDEGVHFAIQKGLIASRSKIKFFKHNDMADLERLLLEQAVEDKKNGPVKIIEPTKNVHILIKFAMITNVKRARITRRFLVCEGLYMKYGDLCPLPKLIELKYKYKFRIFMDETLSFGSIGATGKGVTEYYNANIDDIDLITGSLEQSLGSFGGFCCGRSYVVDHQRLSGLGYCFSASTPPMLARAAIKALHILQEQPGLLAKLQENIQYMNDKLSNMSGLRVHGSPVSPVQFLQLAEPRDSRDVEVELLRRLVNKAETRGVALTLTSYLDQEEHILPPASIKISVSCELEPEEMDECVRTIQQCYDEVCAS